MTAVASHDATSLSTHPILFWLRISSLCRLGLGSRWNRCWIYVVTYSDVYHIYHAEYMFSLLFSIFEFKNMKGMTSQRPMFDYSLTVLMNDFPRYDYSRLPHNAYPS